MVATKKLSVKPQIVLILLLLGPLAMGSLPNDRDNRETLNKVSFLRISFVENNGQIGNGNARYYAKTFGGIVFVTKDGEIVYSLPKNGNTNSGEKANHPNSKNVEEVGGWVIKEHFVGASISKVEGEEQATTRVNYFQGKDPSEWRRGIPTYNIVTLGEIYPGIGLKLKAYGNNVEKLFYVSPGAESEAIQVKIEGASGLNVNEEGKLEVETGLGVVRFTRPIAYQEERGKRMYVDVAYVVRGDGYSFNIDDYDKAKSLVIDPLLASTFLGTLDANSEESLSMTIDNSGNVYMAGYANSSNFPTTTGAYDPTYDGNNDIFISIFDHTLQNLLASTFLGGAEEERPANSKF